MPSGARIPTPRSAGVRAETDAEFLLPAGSNVLGRKEERHRSPIDICKLKKIDRIEPPLTEFTLRHPGLRALELPGRLHLSHPRRLPGLAELLEEIPISW